MATHSKYQPERKILSGGRSPVSQGTPASSAIAGISTIMNPTVRRAARADAGIGAGEHRHAHDVNADAGGDQQLRLAPRNENQAHAEEHVQNAAFAHQERRESRTA